jgi:hypothetical protein
MTGPNGGVEFIEKTAVAPASAFAKAHRKGDARSWAIWQVAKSNARVTGTNDCIVQLLGKPGEVACLSPRGFDAVGYGVASRRMRTRSGSITEKCPAQSVRSLILAARIAPTSVDAGIGNRNSTMPVDTGNPVRPASSPKSLSNVSMILSSRTPHLCFRAPRCEPKQCHARPFRAR